MSQAGIRERILRHPLAALLVDCIPASGCHAVGGIVRDAVRSVATDDLDLSVSDHGAQLASSLALASGGTRIALGGDRFASYRVIADGSQADIWDRQGGDLIADLERRDLTINSIACPFDDGQLLDPFGGLSDLRTKTLRATKEDCFRRDPLRVLRLARFHATLDGFTIDKSTVVAARDAALGLEGTAVERIRDELQRILTAPARVALENLNQLGALSVLVPGTSDLAVSRSLLDSARRLDDWLSWIGTETSESDWEDEDRRIATTSLVLTTPGTGTKPGNAADLEMRGWASRKTLRDAARLLTDPLPQDEDTRRLFVLAHGVRWPLAFAIVAARTPELDPEALRSTAAGLDLTARANPNLLHSVPLLDGHTTAELLGISPGPEVGAALRALTRAQALGLVNSRADAEAFVRKRRGAPRNGGSGAC